MKNYKVSELSMANFEDDIENDEFEENPRQKISRKKILLILLPLLIVIALAVGVHHLYRTSSAPAGNGNYSVVEKPSEDENDKSPRLTVFYDLPEIRSQIRVAESNRRENINIKITIELSSVEDVKTIEALLPRINDIILNHTNELTSDEVNGANGLYWLKEELLYRINLVAAPVKVKNLNFKNFEIQSKN